MELVKQVVIIKVLKGRTGELIGYFCKEFKNGKIEERQLGLLSHRNALRGSIKKP